MQSTLDRTTINTKIKSNHQQTKTVTFKQSTTTTTTNQLPEIIRQTKESLAPIRRSLPIYEYRDALIHAVQQYQNIVVVGETGSGKTTQVPQYLYEAGLVSHDPNDISCICITQPRRVAAMTLAERVSQEIGTDLGDIVGYTIRFDDKSKSSTKLKFVTDGMLLRELQIDPKLTRYNIIVLDEAHERTLNTDILFGLLKLLQSTTRPDLKLVVMSATLDAEKFSQYLNNAPVALIPGRTHPVDVYYLDRDVIENDFKQGEINLTDTNDLVIKTVLQLHQEKPVDGDILVFMPGSDDIEGVKDVLEERAELLMQKYKDEQEFAWLQYQTNYYRQHGRNINKNKNDINDNTNNDINDSNKIIPETTTTTTLNPSPTNINELNMIDINHSTSFEAELYTQFLSEQLSNPILSNQQPSRLLIVPLYSTLAPELQLNAFRPTPQGYRKVILSTNIAETSVTVSGVKYVIDTGLAKVKMYSHDGNGMGTLHSQVISRAEAQQRTGRAGREQPGECYRLYTEDAFENEWNQTPIPEIARAPLSGTILNLISLKIDIKNFPLIDTPSIDAIKSGYKDLIQFNAITNQLQLTDLGRLMANFPIEPIFSRLLILSARPELLWLAELPDIQQQLYEQEQNENNNNNKNNNQNKKINDTNNKGITTKRVQAIERIQSQKFLENLTLNEIQQRLGQNYDPSILCTPCSEEMCILVAALSVDSFVKQIPDKPSTRALKYKVETLQQEHYSSYGDMFFAYNILKSFLYLNSNEKRLQFCTKYYYNIRNLNQALKIYQQICNLMLDNGLPLISSVQTIDRKKAYTFAHFLRNRANISNNNNNNNSNDDNSNNTNNHKNKNNKNNNIDPTTITRSIAVQKYLDENQFNHIGSDYNDDLDSIEIDNKKKFNLNNNDNNNDDDNDEIEWEDNIAKCLTAALWNKLAKMNDSSRYDDFTSGKRVELHPSSIINWYWKNQMAEWKEKKAAQSTSKQNNNNTKQKDLQQYNSSQGAINNQQVNMNKNNQKSVPIHFKDYTDYSHLCYYELVDTSKLYMRGVFRTKKEWLEVFSRGRLKFETIPTHEQSLLSNNNINNNINSNGGFTHDRNDSQINNSYFGGKTAHANLTGKTLAHSVGLGAGQKAIHMNKKTLINTNSNIIPHNNNMNDNNDINDTTTNKKKRKGGKLAIGIGGGITNKNVIQNEQQLSFQANNNNTKSNNGNNNNGNNNNNIQPHSNDNDMKKHKTNEQHILNKNTQNNNQNNNNNNNNNNKKNTTINNYSPAALVSLMQSESTLKFSKQQR